jgi:Ca2+-transporting ATPase
VTGTRGFGGGFGAVPAGVTGLSAAQAAHRLASDGPNRLVPDPSTHGWRHRLGPLADPMVALLAVAVPTYLLLGEALDAVVAAVALVPVALVGWLLEGRAERTLRRLRELAATTVAVLRDGEVRVVPAESVVVGDVVWVREGDVVPADAQVIDATQVSIDEAALTGESLPVAKGNGEDPHLWAGTTVVAGRALALVTATGTATRYGQLGALVARASRPPTPLQRALRRVVGVLGVVAAVCCALAMAAELAHGDGWGEAVIAGVSLAIAAIPEEFPIVYTLYLALGAWGLARRNALVRNLPGIETLGSTTVICTDKTGTLTEGRLELAAVVAASGEGGDTTSDAVLADAVLASEPDPFDPLERALVERARARGVDVDGLHAAALAADWPFDPADRYVTHVWVRPDGTARVAAKGSFEGLARHARVPTGVAATHDRLAGTGARAPARRATAPPTKPSWRSSGWWRSTIRSVTGWPRRWPPAGGPGSG